MAAKQKTNPVTDPTNPMSYEAADEGDLRARAALDKGMPKGMKGMRVGGGEYTDPDAINKAALGAVATLGGGGPELGLGRWAARGLGNLAERTAAKKVAGTAAKDIAGSATKLKAAAKPLAKVPKPKVPKPKAAAKTKASSAPSGTVKDPVAKSVASPKDGVPESSGYSRRVEFTNKNGKVVKKFYGAKPGARSGVKTGPKKAPKEKPSD